MRELAADGTHRFTFFCGGSRNHASFLDLFDGVFLLVVDPETLVGRLAPRGDDEYGGTPEERDFVLRLQRTGEDTPQSGIRIDATAPLPAVVDVLLGHAETIAAG